MTDIANLSVMCLNSYTGEVMLHRYYTSKSLNYSKKFDSTFSVLPSFLGLAGDYFRCTLPLKPVKAIRSPFYSEEN